MSYSTEAGALAGAALATKILEALQKKGIVTPDEARDVLHEAQIECRSMSSAQAGSDAGNLLSDMYRG